jgi:hypothetical protein
MKRKLSMLTCLMWAVVTAALVVYPGCKKTAVSPFSMLYQRWEWVRSSGGIAGVVQTPQSEGYTRAIDFTENGFFTVYQDNAVVISSTYTIIRAESILDNREYDIIVFDNGLLESAIIQLSGDTLVLREEVFDGFTHTYRR